MYWYHNVLFAVSSALLTGSICGSSVVLCVLY